MKRAAVMAVALATASPAMALSWDWQLSGPVDLTVPVDVLDAEPDEVSARDVAALRARGVFTICYVSVGTLEDWRDDAANFPAGVVGRAYDGWPGERFLDVRQVDVLLPLMAARFRHCADLGFEAVEPDNMDGHDNATGFDLRAADTLRYVRALAAEAHRLGLQIGQKNAPELAGKLVQVMDFAVTESCYQDGWCDQMAGYVAAGKPVFDAEYDDRPLDWVAGCAVAGRLGISMILKERDLGVGGRAC